MKKVFFFVAFALCSVLSFAGNIRFEKITDASKLQDNDSVILVCESAKMANGTKTSTGKQLASVAITINSAGEVEMDEETAKSSYLKLMKSGTNWKVMRGTLYMRSSSTDLNFSTSATGSSYTYTWSITCNNDSVLFASTNAAYGIFRYHPTSKFFRTYTSKFGNNVQLYRRISNQATSVTGVTLNKEALSMRVGDAAVTLTATVAPADATNKSISWGSTNSSVASVTNGTVSAVGAGSAKVWVKTADGDKTDTCYVTILPALNTEEATYKAVQKAEYLTEGAKVFFGTSKDGENYIMGLYASGDNIKKADATYGTHTVKAQLAYAYTVEKDGDYYLFKDQDGLYLRCEGEKKLKSGTKDEKSRWIVGAFDADDATVQLKSAYYTTNSYYIFNNHSADLFSTYQGVGDGSYLAKTILYSDKAADWVDRVKDKWIKVSTDYLDWGEQEKDEYATDYPWDTYKTLTITSNDLTNVIKVELKDDGNGTFYSYGDDFDPTKRTSETFSIDWKAASKGEYNGRLEVRCDELDTTIVVRLHAKAVDAASEPENQPQFSASVEHVYLNPNYEDNAYNDTQSFTFSAKNLQKSLYCKWAHTSSILFDYEYQNQYMTIEAGSSDLALNGTVNLGTDDYTNETVTLELNGLSYVEKKYYQTYLQFYSLKKDSKTDYAIDVTIPVMIVISDEPAEDPTGMESVLQSISTQKILRDGQLLIIRNNETYSVMGAKE